MSPVQTAKPKGAPIPRALATQPAPETDANAPGTPFTALLLVEGLETSDGRMFELGSTTWRTPPIPFMIQDSSPHGPGQTPNPAWPGGQLTSIDRDPDDPSRILGHGRLLANADGEKAEQLIRGAMRGVSVDAYGDSPMPPDTQPTVVDEDGMPVSVLVRYADSVISRLTLVPTPAFAPCCVWLDDEPMPQAASDAHGSVIDPDAEPEVVQMPTGNSFEMLVASGGGPLNPPRDWFFTPEARGYQPVEVTPDGRITGHVYKRGQCFLYHGTKDCDPLPPSKTNPPYKSFHRTVAHCNDGTAVACGFVTMDMKHEKALLSVSPGEAMDHYDNTETIGAKVRVSNGAYGTWISGALLPGLDDRKLSILQGPTLSVDTRKWQDPEDGRWYPLELLGLLAVPIQGYPSTRTRPELLVASGGEVIGVFGDFSETPCEDCDEGDPMSAADLDRLEALEQTVSVLVANATPDITAALEDLSLRRRDAKGKFKKTVDSPVDPPASPLTSPATPAASNGETVDLEHGADPIEDPFAVLSMPISASETARYITKYGQPARDEAFKDGHAMRGGSTVILDADDVKTAMRLWNGDERVRQHIIRNADALGLSELTFAPAIALGKYNADDLKALLKKGQAMPPLKPGGPPRFPIGDKNDFDNAVKAVGRAKGDDADHNAVRRYIAGVGKKLGFAPPINWKSDGSN